MKRSTMVKKVKGGIFLSLILIAVIYIVIMVASLNNITKTIAVIIGLVALFDIAKWFIGRITHKVPVGRSIIYFAAFIIYMIFGILAVCLFLPKLAMMFSVVHSVLICTIIMKYDETIEETLKTIRRKDGGK